MFIKGIENFGSESHKSIVFINLNLCYQFYFTSLDTVNFLTENGWTELKLTSISKIQLRKALGDECKGDNFWSTKIKEEYKTDIQKP